MSLEALKMEYLRASVTIIFCSIPLAYAMAGSDNKGFLEFSIGRDQLMTCGLDMVTKFN